MDNIIRGELNHTSSNLLNDEVSRNIVSVQQALAYAGVSDMEFFKSSVLTWIIFGICERLRADFQRD